MSELEERWRDLGEFIREQRHIGHLSLRKLSEMAGVSNPYLSQIERGLRKPSAEILQQIARALEISSETLYIRAGILEERPDGVDLVAEIRRDPWIDEAFATYAQAVVAGQRDVYRLDELPRRRRGNLGAPMSYWAEQGGFGRYEQGVYSQGAALLLEARDRVGADRFDRALRGYIAANAHRVAQPADVVGHRVAQQRRRVELEDHAVQRRAGHVAPVVAAGEVVLPLDGRQQPRGGGKGQSGARGELGQRRTGGPDVGQQAQCPADAADLDVTTAHAAALCAS